VRSRTAAHASFQPPTIEELRKNDPQKMRLEQFVPLRVIANFGRSTYEMLRKEWHAARILRSMRGRVTRRHGSSRLAAGNESTL
jgi:hypothetical protein